MIQKSSQTRPVSGVAEQEVTAARETQFAELTRQWKDEKQYLSSVSQMSMLPSYQRIIGMGPAVLPLLLRELEREPDHWFWALTSVTGDNPVLPEHRGKIGLMRQDWLDWGRVHGYLN